MFSPETFSLESKPWAALTTSTAAEASAPGLRTSGPLAVDGGPRGRRAPGRCFAGDVLLGAGGDDQVSARMIERWRDDKMRDGLSRRNAVKLVTVRHSIYTRAGKVYRVLRTRPPR
ncbi:MAG TPA: hypothetical protein VFT80_03245, partial [Actinomycetota bacterium]|nr:hypothetical protein [Actinomycetota bacterium]